MLKFIPVRGRKLFPLPFQVWQENVEIYPREGTETSRTFWHIHGYTLKFIPVRGRKQQRNIIFKNNCVLEYITVLGGSQVVRLQLVEPKIRLKFIPVRGRKRKLNRLFKVKHAMLKFIPVRGRKQQRNCYFRSYMGLKFIPVRGRKPESPCSNLVIVWVEIYPREGTETVC